MLISCFCNIVIPMLIVQFVQVWWYKSQQTSFYIIFIHVLLFNFKQSQVSLKRLNKFMNAEELDPEAVSRDPVGSGN